MIGELGGDVQLRAGVRELHAERPPGAGIDVQPGEEGGDALLAGADRQVRVPVADGDGGALPQDEVVAPAAVGEVEHLGGEVPGGLPGLAEEDGRLAGLRAGGEVQGVGPSGGGEAGDRGDEQAEKQHAAAAEQGAQQMWSLFRVHDRSLL